MNQFNPTKNNIPVIYDKRDEREKNGQRETDRWRDRQTRRSTERDRKRQTQVMNQFNPTKDKHDE